MASQTGSIDLTASNGVKLMAEAGFESIEENYATKAELDVQADRIGMVVSNNDASSSLQLTADAMTYIGNNVTIKGTDGTTTAISGGRIQANSLSIGALDSAAQSATLNSNISVGGRNLSVVAEYEEGYLQANAQSLGAMNATRQEHTSAYIPVIAGETYVFQNWVTPTTGGSEYLWMAYQLYDSSKALVGDRPSKTAGTNTGLPQHETYVVTIPTGVAFIRISARLYSDGKMKLEKGNIATDWTPAPEDIDEAIQDATGPLFYGKENSSGYIHLGHVPYAVNQASNYSHLHLTGRIGGWLSTTSGSIDVTFKSRTDNALYNTVDRRDETVDTSFVDVLVYTGTDGFTHYWIKVNSYWYAQLYAEFEQFVEDDHTLTATEPDGTCVWKLSEHAAVAAAKSNAVKRTQRIWYRKSASGAPATPGAASSNWVTKADDGNDAWTKMHIAISSTHKYIYTCEQYEMADGTVGYTSVLLDNTITVIDGGNIITGSVTANKLNASDINASKSLTVGAMTDAAAATILNSNVQVGGRNLLVGSSTGTNWLYSTFDPSSVVYTRSTTATTESYVRAPNMTFEAGETYTLSCWAKSNGNVVHMDLYKVHVSGSGSHQSRMSIFLTTEYQKIVWTFTCNATSDEVAYVRFDNNGSTTSGTEAILYVKNPKLERGNRATDWTPAPEDVDSAISDAAKTATNYIGIDSTGIRIANANPSTATTYQHLTATNTEFVAGGNTVATFGSTVTLGNASSSHMEQTGASTTFYGGDGETELVRIEADSGEGESYAALKMAENSIFSANSDGTLSVGVESADNEHRYLWFTLDTADTFEPEDEYGNATFTFSDDSGEVINRVILNGDGSIRSDGQIISYRTVTGKYQVIAENDTSGRSIALESSSAGNIGLYDIDSMRWILWKDSTDLLTIYGLADNFAVTTTAVTSTTAIASGGYLSGSASVSKTGWTPIGVVGWNSSTRYAVTVRAFLYESYVDDGTVNWMVYNAGTSSITPTVSVYVLWARS